MLRIQDLEKRIISIMFVVAAIGCIISFIFLETYLSTIFGILVGTAVSIYRLLSLGRSVDRSLDMTDTSKASNSAKLSYIFRFFIVIIVCVIAAMNHHVISLWGVLFGTANMQISTYIFALLERKNKSV